MWTTAWFMIIITYGNPQEFEMKIQTPLVFQTEEACVVQTKAIREMVELGVFSEKKPTLIRCIKQEVQY